MENAAEALKIAGFTLLFVAALSIAMITVMQGKSVAETIIKNSDRTQYSSDIEEDTDKFQGNNRIVSKYDIIPTLYRYKQEGYIVLFKNSNGNPLKIYEGNTKLKKIDVNPQVSYLNYYLEDKLQEDWRQSNNTIKEHVNEVVTYLLNNNNNYFVETLYYEDENKYIGLSDGDLTKLEIEPEKPNEPIRVITYTVK